MLDLIVCGYFIEKIKNDKLVKTQVKLPSNNCLSTKNKSDLFAQLYKEKRTWLILCGTKCLS